ncbi:hypothetical protein [Crossiella sp. CA198]|uniref:hypothetical protein n=1 Tax=Crossiella sp. CA198 TaxID=3455607 RepID=UPI003F8D7CF6
MTTLSAHLHTGQQSDEAAAVTDCLRALVVLERQHGTRIFDLAVENLLESREYNRRRNAARPELVNEMRAILTAIGTDPAIIAEVTEGADNAPEAA